ncbi:MAG: SGNH/GDSL hydrolase family protein [Oligoflexia bacterium]|nr:SGNH/GDSL hydrolase family protein [Oligoflexia bacterium]
MFYAKMPKYAKLCFFLALNLIFLLVIDWSIGFVINFSKKAEYDKLQLPRHQVSVSGWQNERYLIDPVLGYRLAPNEVYAKFLFPESIYTDKYGFVHNGDPNRIIHNPKSLNTYRIIIFGGSTAASWGATAPSKNLSARIEYYLNKQGKNNLKYEVINAGVMGYYSVIEFLYYSLDLINLKPDLVVFLDGFNDQWGYREGGGDTYLTSTGYYYNNQTRDLLSFLRQNQERVDEAENFKSAFRKLLLDSFLVMKQAFPNIVLAMKRVLKTSSLSKTLKIPLSKELKPIVDVNQPSEQKLFAGLRGKDKFKQACVNIIGVSKINKIKVMLLLQPGLNQKYKKNLTGEEKEIFSYLKATGNWTKFENAEEIYGSLRNDFHDDRTVWVENLLYLFADVKGQTYFDIAHYSDLGLDILASRTSSLISKMNK